MAVLTMPANAEFTRRAWTPPARNQVNRSGWTGARSVVRMPGAAIWRVSVACKPLTREADTWPWTAFLAALEGTANHFLMPYKCGQTAAANPVAGAGGQQGSDQAPIAGMPAGGLYLRGGQAMTFLLPSGSRQLVLLTHDLVADGAGTGLAKFRGALREAPAAAAAIEARNPVCEMTMVTNDTGWDDDEGVFKVAFDAEEAFARLPL
jgi:hypothetical protein